MPEPDPGAPTGDRRILFVTGVHGGPTDALVTLLVALGGTVPGSRDVPRELADVAGPEAWAEELHAELAERYGLARPDARPESLIAGAQASYDNRAHEQLDAWLTTALARSGEIIVDDPWFPWLTTLWQVAASRAGATIATAIVVDHPAAYAAQRRWGGAAYPEVALAADWINTMLTLERATRGDTRSVVSYDALAADWPLVVKTLGDDLGLDFVQGATANRMVRAHDVAPPSPHDAAGDERWRDLAVPADIRALAGDVHRVLSSIATGGDDAAAHRELDELRDRFAARFELAAATSRSSIETARKAGRRGEPR